eukprot:TRINITY_DN58345_c0_g1_i1.p1 TRINITY_DN58345_c0_g1~~TRINITY_DN58345_c0_g1_i1.p1  ORF type:complete len:307 (-),score=34.13 TRINITY_DN58345_c0_g1_i1:291-1211(-)
MAMAGLVESAPECSRQMCEQNQEDCCAICFEQGPFVNLPCHCKLKYCTCCWDRALATSVTICGRAQCPSCRSAFKVDYDVNASSLVFTADSEGAPARDWQTKLYGKVKGVQIKILESFSTDCFYMGETLEEEGRDNTCQIQPACVCGAELEHISSRARIVRLLEDMQPDWRSGAADPEGLIHRMLDNAVVTCDICNNVALETNGAGPDCVWTCTNGPHTLMHPRAYDVCETCFEKFAGCGSAMRVHSARRGDLDKQPPPSCKRSRRRLSVGCSRACAVVFNALPRPWNRRMRLGQGTQRNPSQGLY